MVAAGLGHRKIVQSWFTCQVVANDRAGWSAELFEKVHFDGPANFVRAKKQPRPDPVTGPTR